MRDRALEDYREAIRLDPRIAAAYAASGRLRDEKGERDQAIRDYDMALQLDPKEVACTTTAETRGGQNGDWQGALADYDRAIVLDPEAGGDVSCPRLVASVRGGPRRRLRRPQPTSCSRAGATGFLPTWPCWRSSGARDADRGAQANRVLDEALANLSPRAWPVPVFRYLRGEITEAAMEAAKSDRQQTEAHAFLGLDRLRRRRQARDGSPQLGEGPRQPGSIAADVARAALRTDRGGRSTLAIPVTRFGGTARVSATAASPGERTCGLWGWRCSTAASRDRRRS